MKIKNGYVTHKTGSEQLMISVDGGFSGMVRSNKTASEIVDMLSSDVTKEDIVLALLEKYDAPREVIEADVDKVLDALRQVGAIDE